MAGESGRTIYTLLRLEDGRHGVKVSTPGRFPPEFHEFDSEEHARIWIEGHRRGSEQSN